MNSMLSSTIAVIEAIIETGSDAPPPPTEVEVEVEVEVVYSATMTVGSSSLLETSAIRLGRRRRLRHRQAMPSLMPISSMRMKRTNSPPSFSTPTLAESE